MIQLDEKKQEPGVKGKKMTPAVLVPRNMDERQLQINRMHVICKVLDIPVPAPGSREEEALKPALKVLYKNITRFYKDHADAKSLPRVVVARREANIPREQKFREDVRHIVSYGVTLLTQPILGGIGTLVANIADAFVAAISHAPIVMGAGLVVFLIAFLYQASQYSQTTQALNGAVVGSILGWSLLWAVAAAFAAGVLKAFVKYAQRLQEQKAAEEGWNQRRQI